MKRVLIVASRGDRAGTVYAHELSERGHEVRWVTTDEIMSSIRCGGEKLTDLAARNPYAMRVRHRNSRAERSLVSGVDAAIIASDTHTPYVVAMAYALDAAGIALQNSPQSMEICGDKWLSRQQLLEAGGVVMPLAGLAATLGEALDIAQSIVYPVVLKARAMEMGQGVVFARNENELRFAYDQLDGRLQDLIVEQYVEYGAKTGYARIQRMYVFADSVPLGAKRRVEKYDPTRFSTHGLGEQRSSVKLWEMTDAEKALGLKVSESMGLSASGLDFGVPLGELPGREHLALEELVFVEANACFGLGVSVTLGYPSAAVLVAALVDRVEMASETRYPSVPDFGIGVSVGAVPSLAL